MRRSLVCFAVAALAACAPATPPPSVEPAPEVTPAASEFPTVPPVPGPVPTLTLPNPVTRSLPNGLAVVYVPHGDLPLVHATLVTRGGRSDDPAARPGLAAFTAEMLDEGAGGRNALQLAADLDLLGASLSTRAGWDAAQVDVEVLRSRLPEALALMADVVVRPDFPASELRRIREEQLTSLAAARDEPRVIAANAYSSLLFGAKHPYGRLVTTEVARGFDRPALVEFHRSFYQPGASTLLLVGDVDPDSLHSVVERAFGQWSGGAVPAATAPAAPTTPATKIYLIDKPGAAQSEVRIGNPGVQRDSPDYFPLVVLNTLLGGSFTSRLNANLREQHGYSYGAGSSFDMRRGVGPFTASSAVVTAKTDSAVIEFFNELNRIRSEAVPADELERAKNYVALGLPRSLETAGGVASRLAELRVYDLPLSFYDTYVAKIMAVTAEDVQRVANQYVRPGQSTVVIVGDRKAIEPGLRAIELGNVEIRTIQEFVR
jgi:zinc protease